MPMEDFFVPMCVMNKVYRPDGLGSVLVVYEDGPSFDGGIVLNSTTEMLIAQQEGRKSIYTLTTSVPLPLEIGDRVKRLSDEALFKITSDGADMQPPTIASVTGTQVTMERVEA